MPHVTAIIPARLESKRFSRKVICPLKGKPLIFYAWKAAQQAKLVNRVFVATDSTVVGQAVNNFGGAVIMTSKKPRNGTERVAEAVKEHKTDIVVNIQADNYGLTGAVLDRVLREMIADHKIGCATLARKIQGKGWKQKLDNPDVVKVVANDNGHALWFSRYPIPFIQSGNRKTIVDRFSFMEHIGVYFFRKQVLMEYAGWPPAWTEKTESLEQLRILQNEIKIRLFPTRVPIISIDNRATLKKLNTKAS